MCGWRRKVWKESDARFYRAAARFSPVGRVSAPVSPPLRNFFTRLLFFPPLHMLCMSGFWGQRRGQEVGRAERAESEERTSRPTSCPQDTRPTLWPGHRPLPSSHARPQAGQTYGAPSVRLSYRPDAVHLAQGLGMINNSERGRRLLITNPIPLNPLGLWAILPFLIRLLAFSSRCKRHPNFKDD